MRTRPVPARWIVAALVAALLAPLAAGARLEPGEGRLDSDAPPRAYGLVALQGDRGVVVLSSWDMGTPRPTVDIVAREATLEVVTVTVRVLESPWGDVGLAPERDARTYRGVAGAVLLSPDRGFEVAAAIASGALHANATLAGGSLPLLAAGFEHSYMMDAELPYFHRSALDEQGAALGADALVASGKMDVLLAGAVVRAQTAEGPVEARLGWRRDALAPGGGGPSTETYTYAVLSMHEGDLRAQPGAGALTAFVATDVARLVGELRCGMCDGEVKVGPVRYAGSRAPIVVAGDLLVTLPAEQAPTVYAFRGDVSRAGLGALVRYESPVVPTLAALGILLLALACLALLYTRLTRKQALESAERRGLLDIVRAEPGLHLRALQRRADSGWGKLHYHLHVLLWAGLVRLERRGKHVHVVPRERTTGTADLLAPRGAALRVLRALPSSGGWSSGDVARATGLSRQLVGHHLRRLEEEGLVRSVPSRPRRFSRVREPRPR